MINKKILYISDLDGTLLNQNIEISQTSAQIINDLIKKGMNFSIATARSSETAVKILSCLKINVPVILMNGVLVYDINKKEFIKIEKIDLENIKLITEVLDLNDVTGFMFSVNNNKLSTYYQHLQNQAHIDFYNERVEKYNKKFTQTDSFYQTATKTENIIYFALLDTKEKLHPVFEKLKDNKNLKMEFYEDIYSKDLWYLEIFSLHASKYNAVLFLKEHCGFDEIIGFGDNLNDLPLFLACDKKYAVANAKEPVKLASDAIIDSNLNDGVAKWLETNYI